MKRKPVCEIRLGLIVVRIWRKRKAGPARYSVSVIRLYRDGDQWKHSTRFGRDDLPVLRRALDLAHTWIFEHQETFRT